MKSIAHLLKKEFTRRKAKNAAYTLRSFAKFLDVDHSQLSKILREERSAGKVFIEKVGKRLGLSHEEISLLHKRKAISKKLDYYTITDQIFESIANYKYDVLVELIKTSDFKGDYKWIAKKIGSSAEDVDHYVRVLTSLKLLEITAEGEWKDLTNGACLHISSQKDLLARKNYHKEIFEASIKSLTNTPGSKQIHSSMIMATNQKKVDDAQKMIAKFRDKLVAFLEDCDDKNAVFCLHTSLFPLTDSNKGIL